MTMKIQITKGQQCNATKPTHLGQIVSVDQLVSPSSGLIAQMTVFITKQPYKDDTVYVNQYSGLIVVHLKCIVSVEERRESKQASKGSHGSGTSTSMSML